MVGTARGAALGLDQAFKLHAVDAVHAEEIVGSRLVHIGVLSQNQLCLRSTVLFNEHLFQLFVVDLHLVLTLLKRVQAIEIGAVRLGAVRWSLVSGLLASVGHYLSSRVGVLLDKLLQLLL
uniref:Uncharacterized protein n=1 Tax=Strombidium inclinatum TaxID=197538 RepID=A0A7S3IJ90_9SPIT